MEVKVLFRTSKQIHPKFGTVKFGKYAIEPMPAEAPLTSSATNRYLLRFEDEMRAGEKRSNPAIDAKLTLSYLSLALGTQLTFDSMMVNSVNVPFSTSDGSPYEGVFEELPPLDTLYKRLQGMQIDIARQFLRACEVYRSAINTVEQNNALSYFLFTVAVECLSNKLAKGKGKCEKFINFILQYLTDRSELSEEDWKELLKEVYNRHRSGFTHGGKELPEASNLADRLKRVYVRNIIDGKEIRTPGLNWFASVVRETLLGYLASVNESNRTGDVVKDISLEYGTVQLKVMRGLQAGAVITENDVQLD